MLTPNTKPVNHPTTPECKRAVEALTAELRALYTNTFRPALAAAERAQTRYETPDGGSPIDPIYAADTSACRAVNAQLANTMRRHLPDARQVTGIDEPAVIDSQWLLNKRVIVIEWDHDLDFGDPEALTVREVAQ